MRWRVRKPGVRRRAKRMWHRYYAWRPVRVPTRGRMSGVTMVWGEWIERKGKYHYSDVFNRGWWTWKYRGGRG